MEVSQLFVSTYRLVSRRLSATAVVKFFRISHPCGDAFSSEREVLLKEKKALASDVAALAVEAVFVDLLSRGATKDIVELNISGECMVTRRATLMLCSDSSLARKFDDAVWVQQNGDVCGVSTLGAPTRSSPGPQQSKTLLQR